MRRLLRNRSFEEVLGILKTEYKTPGREMSFKRGDIVWMKGENTLEVKVVFLGFINYSALGLNMNREIVSGYLTSIRGENEERQLVNLWTEEI